MLTPAQKIILKAAIQAAPAVNPFYVDGNLSGLADALNAEAAPFYWVWRADVSRAQVYTQQNDLPINPPQTGFWSWGTYKTQNITEQNAWVQMFMQDTTDFSKSNLRDGIANIFSGSAAANAQRDHCLAIGRRHASFAEKALATGTGSTASPATMGFDGQIGVSDLIGL